MIDIQPKGLNKNKGFQPVKQEDEELKEIEKQIQDLTVADSEITSASSASKKKKINFGEFEEEKVAVRAQ